MRILVLHRVCKFLSGYIYIFFSIRNWTQWCYVLLTKRDVRFIYGIFISLFFLSPLRSYWKVYNICQEILQYCNIFTFCANKLQFPGINSCKNRFHIILEESQNSTILKFDWRCFPNIRPFRNNLHTFTALEIRINFIETDWSGLWSVQNTSRMAKEQNLLMSMRLKNRLHWLYL